MGRHLTARCKLCRREGTKLSLKGIRCVTEKCAMTKKPKLPGMHTMGSSKSSYYALQLREKQKAKRIYGMSEQQFKRFFLLASKSKGVTGRTLLQLLERRLDNVLFRSLFCASLSQARQFVRHGFLFIGDRRVSIPSYLVKSGEQIVLKANEKVQKNIKEISEINSKERSVPSWLDVDRDQLIIKILRLPEKEDRTLPVNEQLIIELYSK